MSERDVIIRTTDLTKHFEDGRVKALNGVSVEIRRGEFIAIVGPSGSGKSTFLNMISALDRPTSGTIEFAGTTLTRRSNLDEIRSHKIGFIFQLHNLLPHLTAAENVIVPMLETTERHKPERAAELLRLIGIQHLAEKIPTKMSGGERQRVAIARALANDPVVILGDEPTGDVDTATGRQLMDILKRLNAEQGVTLIIVTHAPDIANQAQRIIEFRDGKIVGERPGGRPQRRT